MGTALVTGANRGIGLELCRQLQARGESVIAVCRASSQALDGLGVRVESGVDVAADGAPSELARRLGDSRLDLLIHCAGILRREPLEDLDAATVRDQIEVNAIAPLRITAALLPRLGKASKIGLITSLMGSMSDNSSGGWYGYRMSKAALNAAGVSLARDLRDRGIVVAILHPGFVRTEMTGGMGNVDPAEAARGLIARLDEVTLEASGSFRHANGNALPW